MLLLAAGNLPKLLLRHALEEPLHARKHLIHALPIQLLAHGFLNQLFDLDQALAVEMLAQPLIHLPQHLREKLLTGVLPPDVKHLVHKPHLHQLLARNPLAHDQRLVRLGYAQALHEANRRIALRHQPQRRERGKQKRMRRGVNKVRERDERGAQADGGAVQGGDEDLGVRVEGVRDVQVVSDEAAEPLLAGIDGAGVGLRAERDVCAAVYCQHGVIVENVVWCGVEDVYARGKESAFACQDGDEDFVVLGDFVHGARELVVCFAAEGVEFRGDVEGDDCELAAVFHENGFFLGRHDCCVFPLQDLG